MDRHDFAFKSTYAEMAPCGAGSGLAWAIDNVLEAWDDIAKLPRAPGAGPAAITLGSAASLPFIPDGSVTAVVVDPPYADNVQYSELADFFYVWLKRTQGDHHPDWFSGYLSDHDEEAVVNLNRHRAAAAGGARGSAKDARADAHRFYQAIMAASFREARRVLRDDGALTVMFTHKQQSAWESLFASLIEAGFTITATWPIKTESEHSLHQARKNAAQSTVILVARKRTAGAGVGFFDAEMRRAIARRARETAERLRREGLNPVDQLVGAFGPAIEVFSQYDSVRSPTGEVVGVGQAIEEASDEVSRWRIEQVAAQGLAGVEPEGQFALLCWDVLAAAEFRFNEASLLGRAVGMDVNQLIAAGLVTKTGENIKMLSAKERRRDRPLAAGEAVETLFGPVPVRTRVSAANALKVHPSDPSFRTALDGCHALALRYLEATTPSAGIGSASALARQQSWLYDSPAARLMEALVRVAPPAVRFEKGATSAAARFPEFRAWHALLEPLFRIKPPEWIETVPLQANLPTMGDSDVVEDEDDASGDDSDES